FFGVYPAVYLPLFDCINNSGHPLQEVILLFFLFNAAIEYAFSSLDTCKEGLLGSLRNFIAHEDAKFLKLLPLPIESQERPNFKVTCSDIKRLGDVGPVMQIISNLPVGVAIIYNKKVRTVLSFFCSHNLPISP